MVRSNEEKVEMILCYGESGRNIHQAVRLYNEKFPDMVVDRAYMRRLVHKFTTTFSLGDAPRSGRPSTTTEEDEIEMLAQFSINPHSSIRMAASEVNISKSSIQRVLKKHKFHPYKIELHQELNEDDFDRRIQFCEQMLQKIQQNAEFISMICFSDEATFNLHGTINRHNSRYWSNQNPHWMTENHTQHPQKLNVWAGILGNSVVGPFIFNGNLNGPQYLEMLQHNIVPAIHTIRGDCFFQQDGAPPHYDINVRAFLNQTFPERWIGRRGAVEWPARSPDLTPLDFFFWGFLKTKVYETRPQNLDELRMRIENACRLVTPEMLENVRHAFESRLYFCQEVNGGHFEHLL